MYMSQLVLMQFIRFQTNYLDNVKMMEMMVWQPVGQGKLKQLLTSL